jgi:amino acid adenylation domain-containing protein
LYTTIDATLPEMIFSKNNTILTLFADQSARIPYETAIVFENKKISYLELDVQSDRLAGYLEQLGVTKETLVPVCVSDPLEMVMAILAILKIGAAYVPVDPEFPAERIAFMISDSAAEVVISDSGSIPFLAAAQGKITILLDQDKDKIRESTTLKTGQPVTTGNLAYVIYTSGSTGMPKGVLIEHRHLVDYVKGLYETVPIAQCQTYALGATMATDLGNTVLYSSLALGGTLHLFTKENFNTVTYIHAYFQTHRIDCLKIVPSHWKSLALDGKDLLPQQLLIFGGEALHTTLINELLTKTPACTLVNHYGPTETTIGKLLHIVEPGRNYNHTVPIGKSFTGAPVYLLNDVLEQVKDSETGEIYIGGDGVARGYLHRADLTAERFLNDPFSSTPAARMYRTGDLARKLQDGNIEYLGRIDDQVKIRGYRIELGEIESILQKAPGVKQAVVMAREDSIGNKRLIGYVVCPHTYHKPGIITFLESKLPPYMVPQLLMQLPALPFTPNGKVDKKSLPDPDASTLLTNIYYAPDYETERQITALWKELLGVSRAGIEDNFFELGGNSLLAQKFVSLLKERHQLDVPVTKLYQYPKPKDLAAFLDGRKSSPRKRKPNSTAAAAENKDIAIIGMSGRFPGADSISELWELLKEGKETTRFFSEDELDPSLPPSLRDHPDYVKARGIVNNVQAFDAAFFGITPKLADLMDPQQRIFLEIAWEAIEQAGYAASNQENTIGVFAGVRHNSYYDHNVIPNQSMIDNVGRFPVVTVNDKDYVATRTAYALDLKGPAVNVQSACSTSLLAVAQAVQSIRAGQCDMAIAGGSTINSPVNIGHLYEEGAMLSNDGHCRPFDAAAEGTVFSDGAGVVLLKSKAAALRDGDFIFAVIKGVGLSNDGGGKGSFTAPSAEGQADAIRMAIDDAGVDPSVISYIETHGTATPLGDPIEIEGLNMAFGEQPVRQYCAIGSIKSNFGHLTCAAGVTGLIKAALSLHHKLIPASINFDEPNPDIDFKNSPFIVNTTLKTWDNPERIAGVSSFGVGGTNVHVVLEGYENSVTENSASRPVQLITWSAKNEKSLNSFTAQLASVVADQTGAAFADQAYTLNTFRKQFNRRRFAVATEGNNLSRLLQDTSKVSAQTKKNIREVVFMFPGQGSQYINMGKALYLHERIFTEAMDECNILLKHYIQEDLLSIIYPDEITPETEEKLKNTRYSQPALFMTGYALAKLWMSWGIYPSAFIGHSIGEFVAAHFAGILNLPDALKIIATRGQLMSELPAGSMLSIRGKAEEILPILPGDISVAAINSPVLFVVAGTLEAIAAFSSVLDQKEIANRLLPTSHAFHSYMMDNVVVPFKEAVSSVQLNKPVIPIYSTVTGEKLQDHHAVDPEYWANHLRATVQFATAAKILLEDHHDKAFLELGPGNAAATFIRQQPAAKNSVVITCLEKPVQGETAYHTLLKAAGQLWLNGLDLDWTAFYVGEQRNRRYDLPVYAFNKTNHWVNPPPAPAGGAALNIIPQQQIQPLQITPVMRKQSLINKIKDILEDTSGIEMQDVSSEMSFIEMGLDSLLLTQISIALKKNFSAPITFRQLNEEFNNLDQLAAYLDTQLPPDTTPQAMQQTISPTQQFPPQQQQPELQNPVQYQQPAYTNNGHAPSYSAANNGSAIELISQQLQLLARQLALLQGTPSQGSVTAGNASPADFAQANVPQPVNGTAPKPVSDYKTADLTPEELIEIKKPFGASPRIEKQSAALTDAQQTYLAELVARYTDRTKASKTYTQENRSHMADPRVVSGFKPATKELVYSVVINKSKGSRFWDIDGNEYIDAVNGFGSNMLGYQPDVIKDALIAQIEKGYEIGPQHELAGEVSKLICEFTNFDRSALCNTGSEAVLGAMRIARTVTGRSLIVAFTGSYHGIVDEVIVRGSKKHKTFPAAPGIMPEAVQNMLILDYGTDETLQIIKDRAHELAAVLVEPVQSRRPEFLPLEFLKELRTVTEESGTALIFDEVISGFRFHPGGVQAITGIKADLGTYGKVAGGGISIGIIAGKRKFMDALDGGFWQFGDDSIPEIGVTYFAGTFVRHPLALATTKASLTYMKEQGPELQQSLNEKTSYIADSINAIIKRLNVPMFVAHYGSLWRVKFIEDYPYTELFFTLMRYKGIHILEGFSCFLTSAHTREDIDQIINTFEECLLELKTVNFIPEYQHPLSEPQANSFAVPPLPGAKLGKDKDGNPGWFVIDNQNPGKYLQVN